MIRIASLLTLATAALFGAGCNVDPYCLNCVDGAVDSGPNTDQGPPDLGEGGTYDGCVYSGPEICDGLDNDCNGTADDGDLPGTGGACNTGKPLPCMPGVFACVDGMIKCDGAVLPSVEICDTIDNDCNGTVDDNPFDAVGPCGEARGDCEYGTYSCVDGEKVCMGGVGPEAESCDGRDNDCDGMIDNGNPGGGGTCGVVEGVCGAGTYLCLSGEIICYGVGIPMAERCDNVDNNCDGNTDEGFDLMTDRRNCGACGRTCNFANSVSICSSGTCDILACQFGYYNVDGMLDNGCEYSCLYAGQEVCNGVDDDCDGSIDEGVIPPAICAVAGECAGTVAACEGARGWACHYGPTVSTDSAGAIIPETDCNDQDNDCDGVADDSFSEKGRACARGIGACRRSGVLACNSTHDGVLCNAAEPGTPALEICNGSDDDCDGQIDANHEQIAGEVCREWVTVTNGSTTYQIFAYEAARLDSSTSEPGSINDRPVSATGRLPWTNVTYGQAKSACESVGARLCTEAEWQNACQVSSSSPCSWSYATACTTYNADTCNGNEHDSDPDDDGDQDAIAATGAFAQCYAAHPGGGRVYDLSGNVREWTARRSANRNPIRGGSYNTIEAALQCSWDFVVADDAFLFQNVGFRCCR